jgi:hypothetical protein
MKTDASEGRRSFFPSHLIPTHLPSTRLTRTTRLQRDKALGVGEAVVHGRVSQVLGQVLERA